MIKKEFNNKPIIKEDNGIERFEFVLSSGAIDRHFEKVDVEGIDYKNFLKNPVAFWNHNSYNTPIGKWVEIYKAGDKLFGVLEFQEVEEFAVTLKNLTKQGYINAVSIGFKSIETDNEPIPKSMESAAKERYINSIVVHKKTELLETSLVTIPANPEAVRIKALNDFANDNISEKELELIETTLKAGQVLNKKNKDKLKQAAININEVLESAEKDEGEKETIDYEKIENYLINKLTEV